MGRKREPVENDINLSNIRFNQLITIANKLEESGDFAGASIYWCKAARVLPGNALPFTARCRYLLRRRYGIPSVGSQQMSLGQTFSMSRLGTWGRFGNQVLQYLVLRVLAERYSANVETAEWIGRDLFKIQDPFVSDPSRNRVEESHFDLHNAIAGTDSRCFSDLDLKGWFCGPTGIFSQYRSLVYRIFQYRPALESQLQCWRSQLVGNGEKLVAIHLRRGDFIEAGHFVAPTFWYQACLKRLDLNGSVLYIASDDQDAYKDFIEYDPVQARDVTDWPSDLDFIFDFYMLSKADIVLISNSTFSFMATMLNQTGSKFYRPIQSEETLIDFDPWSSLVLL
jgi:hypothetical protein